MLLANAMGCHHTLLSRIWTPNRMERLECTGAGGSRHVWDRVPAPLLLPLHLSSRLRVSTAEVSLGQAGQRDRVALLPISILDCYHSNAACDKCPQRTYK